MHIQQTDNIKNRSLCVWCQITLALQKNKEMVTITDKLCCIKR